MGLLIEYIPEFAFFYATGIVHSFILRMANGKEYA
jgi:hypothetical protein